MESSVPSSDFDGEVDIEQPGNRHCCGPCKIQTNSNIKSNWYCTHCDDFLCSDCKSWHGAIKATSGHEICSAGNIIVHSCGPCKAKNGTTVNANQYCVDCDDFLCADCKQRHASLKATEKHVIQLAVRMSDSKPPFTKSSYQLQEKARGYHTTATYSTGISQDVERRSTAANPMKDRSATFEKSINVRAPTDIEPIHVAGSTILFDSKQLLLTDYFNKKLKMFDAGARLVSFKQFDKEPWDLAVFSTSEIAVTFPNERKIRRLTMDACFAEKGYISTRARCYGVAYINEDKIAITEADEGAFLVMRIDGCILSTSKMNEVFSLPWHLTLNRSRTVAYVSDYGNSAVYAIDLERNNNIVFIYKHKQLQGPLGVTLDTDGNVYVCGADSRNVHQISPAGRFIKILLTRETDCGINRPWTICFGPGEDYFILTGDNMEDLAQYNFK